MSASRSKTSNPGDEYVDDHSHMGGGGGFDDLPQQRSAATATARPAPMQQQQQQQGYAEASQRRMSSGLPARSVAPSGATASKYVSQQSHDDGGYGAQQGYGHNQQQHHH